MTHWTWPPGCVAGAWSPEPRTRWPEPSSPAPASSPTQVYSTQGSGGPGEPKYTHHRAEPPGKLCPVCSPVSSEPCRDAPANCPPSEVCTLAFWSLTWCPPAYPPPEVHPACSPLPALQLGQPAPLPASTALPTNMPHPWKHRAPCFWFSSRLSLGQCAPPRLGLPYGPGPVLVSSEPAQDGYQRRGARHE